VHKPAPDAAFEATQANVIQPCDGDTQPEFFRPNEGDRLARAKRWLEQARGKTANLQTAEDTGR
jgi:hypothetical protein